MKASRHEWAAAPRAGIPRRMSAGPPGDGQDDPAARRKPSLLRRCALGFWLCGIALMGAVEFLRHAPASGEFSMTPVAWMWLVGSLVTGATGTGLLVRELRRRP